jgi:hypothetical protein
MALTLTQINQLYVSYFGRPADFAGASYYQTANATPNQVAAAFAASAESQALYGNLSAADQVNTIYQNLFGRSAEIAGLQYWTQQINSGAISLAGVALAIGNAAQGTDQTTLFNKVIVANSFTSALDTTNEVLGYSGTAAAASARSFLTTVTATNLTASQSAVDSQVAAAVTIGSTYSLTANTGSTVDTLVGTARDEFFVGSAATIQTGDSIDGGAGIDTFIYNSAAAGYTLPTLTNVELLQFNTPTATTINTSAVTGITGVTVVGAATGTNVTTASGVNTTFTGNSSTAVAALTATNTGATVAVGVASGLNVTTLTVTDTALATLNLSSTGSANTIGTLTTTAVAGTTTAPTTLNVTGSAKLTITNAIDNNFTVVNAAGSTGGVDIAVGNGAVTATGGSGNDRFNFGATLTTADKVDGGAGVNTVAVSGADLTTASNVELAGLNAVTNIQTVEFTGATGTTIAGGTTATSFTNTAVTKLLFNTTGADTVNAAGSARTYAFGSSNDGAATFNNGTGVTTTNLSLEGSSTAIAKAAGITVNLNSTDLTATPSLVSTINIASSGSYAVNSVAQANTTGLITAQAGSTIKITGSQDLTTSVATKSIVDASAFTGKLSITGSTGADVITLGSAADTVIVGYTAASGSGNTAVAATAGSTYTNLDTINGFVKADTLVLGSITNTATSLVKFDATNSVSFEQALVSAEQAITGSGVTASYFNYGGNTYVVANTDSSNSVTATGSTDLVVKIAGVQTLTADTAGIHGA